ncbi:MAG: glutamate-1-semialdehyde 2,1-aminomutase [bacterium]
MSDQGQKSWHNALQYLVGGVNSPVRAFKAVGGTPLFMQKGKGAYLYDIEGNKYIDYVGSWGPMILGHVHPLICEALKEVLERGTSFGTPTEIETELAQLIIKMVPSVEMLRMVNSGTEAVMSALRLARGYTGRNKIIKFEGCYHGHADSMLVKAGSGAATLGIPDSKGIPQSVAHDTITIAFNDIEAIQNIITHEAESIAAVIIEPVAGNMGVIPPCEGLLKKIRELTAKNDILLIFDEVMTGFRVAPGGAQQLFNIMPDLTCMGKVIGGGLPVGAFGGRKAVMELLAPVGPVYQAGTLSGNPLATTAGFKTLELLDKNRDEIYPSLEEKSLYLAEGIKNAARNNHIAITVNRVGSMLSPFFTKEKVYNYTTAQSSSTEKYATCFWALVNQGVYIPPSQFESHFISATHDHTALNKTIEAYSKAFKALSFS